MLKFATKVCMCPQQHFIVYYFETHMIFFSFQTVDANTKEESEELKTSVTGSAFHNNHAFENEFKASMSSNDVATAIIDDVQGVDPDANAETTVVDEPNPNYNPGDVASDVKNDGANEDTGLSESTWYGLMYGLMATFGVAAAVVAFLVYKRKKRANLNRHSSLDEKGSDSWNSNPMDEKKSQSVEMTVNSTAASSTPAVAGVVNNPEQGGETTWNTHVTENGTKYYEDT